MEDLWIKLKIGELFKVVEQTDQWQDFRAILFLAGCITKAYPKKV